MKNPEIVSRRQFIGSTGKAAVAMSCCVLCPRATVAAPGKEGREIEFKLVAPCGIYCGACEDVVAGLNGKDTSELSCCGCLSAKVNGWVRTKCKVRPCVMKRNIESCALCQQYPCDKIRGVLSWSKEAGNNLKIIREQGLEEFKKQQKAAWSCRNCGAAFSSKDTQCRKCGKPVQRALASHSAQPSATAGSQGGPNPADRMKKVKQLFEEGLINKEEYDSKIKEIVDSI